MTEQRTVGIFFVAVLPGTGKIDLWEKCGHSHQLYFEALDCAASKGEEWKVAIGKKVEQVNEETP